MNVKYPLTSSFLDYPDNENIAVVVYIMGCDKTCEGCHNPEFKNPYYRIDTKEMSVEVLADAIKTYCERNQSNKVVLSGGDPLHPINISETKDLLNILSDEYDVMIYTSYDIEYVKSENVKGFSFIKCGVFIKDKYQGSEKTNEYIKFASDNQKLYDTEYNLISINGIYFFKEA